jgi:hypothetical protein
VISLATSLSHSLSFTQHLCFLIPFSYWALGFRLLLGAKYDYRHIWYHPGRDLALFVVFLQLFKRIIYKAIKLC